MQPHRIRDVAMACSAGKQGDKRSLDLTATNEGEHIWTTQHTQPHQETFCHLVQGPMRDEYPMQVILAGSPAFCAIADG
jgi:hypothetical protein